jgi:ADP-heptose:LPS heptosyltransferase
LQPLGIESPRVRFDVPKHDADQDAVDAGIHEARLESGFAVINPGASWPTRRWRPTRYGEVARYLGEVYGLPTVVVWAIGWQECGLARQIVSHSGGFARQASATSLTQLAALVRRCMVFVGSDTGPLHLAAALGIPCVGLYGPTSSQRNGPYGSKHEVVQKTRTDSPLSEWRKASRDLMDLISVSDVCQACDRILLRAGRQLSTFQVLAANWGPDVSSLRSRGIARPPAGYN